MKVTREAKTAILVIVSILLFIWGYSFLKGRDLFNSYKTFYVIYNDVEGLAPSAPVTLNGLTIGKVNSITFRDTVQGTLLVELQVKTDFPISTTSSATLYEPGLGLVGGKQIAITPDTKNPKLAADGDYLRSVLKPGMLSVVGDKLSPLQTKVEATVVTADSLLHNLSNVFDRQTQQNLRVAILEMSNTMKEFNSAAHSLNGVIAGNKQNIDATLANLNKTSANFAKISDSINNANLGEAVKKLEKTLANVDKIMNDVEAGKGTLGKLLKDDAMYNNLNGASKELKQLLADVKNNPKRYIHLSVFGKKGTPYVEPAEEKAEDQKAEEKKLE
ncbi:MlaD family protein [Flavobacterium subsaxonicum]|uniref:Organic solvent ABC transporter substrate-binding protein n=1 Tax=Flavobacterium subsaxonicum WB 4.1-42 = DSM 21790 TaxID=1121898 RepID=A0A0A2N285_9FLAO|nr:MlaD family protein [Flavobacterium subsaxonicum]KGO94560.1 organic solvent ABC transporter substrate-binding protein [Flavobacterium subsaxonicum WB 4.1-42 = DSM 21790]